MVRVDSSAGLVDVVARLHRSVPVCEVRGEVDASNVEAVLLRLEALVPQAAPGLVLDLSRTSYLDSAGVRILFELARRLRQGGQELRIVAPSDGGIVRRVLVLTALADVVPVHDEVDEAVAAVQARS
jgi:anti-anti-sigma factor